MRRKARQWTSMTLILALLISVLPAVPAFAANPNIRITNLYSPDNPSNFNDDLVTRLTDSNIQVKADFSDFDPAKIHELYYEVINETTGRSIEEKLNKARQTDSYELTFDNVRLTEGRNKIVIKYGDTDGTSFPPAYVYYSSVSNITDLKIDTDVFVDHQILPTMAKQSLIISGNAPNATEVRAFVDGDTTPMYAQLNNGRFFFVAEDINLPTNQRQSTFGLTPGDNLIEIEARNNTNSYFTTRNLIYDNGSPFAYSAMIQDTDTAGAQPVKLKPSPVLSPANGNVTIRANLKVDINQAGVTQSVYGELKLSGGQTFGIPFPLNANDPTPAGLTKITQTERYVVYQFTQNATLSLDKRQLAEFSFVDRANSQYVVKSSFNFTYQRPNAKFVDTVALKTGDLEIPLSETAGNTVIERPITLVVKTKNLGAADGINVYLGEQELLLTAGVTRLSDNHFEISLDNQIDGRLKVKIVPHASGTEDPTGEKKFNLDINTVPYVIVNSLFNGMVVKEITDFVCSGTTTSPSCLSGRIVNLPAAEYSNVVLTLNGQPMNQFGDSINAATGVFRYSLPTGTELKEGNNIFEFLLKIGGTDITKATYTVFKSNKAAPEFLEDIVLHAKEGLNKFVAAQTPGMYATHEAYVAFSGQFNYGTSGLKVTVRKKDKDGNPVISYDAMPGSTPLTRTGGTIKPDDYDVTEPGNSGPYYIKSLSLGSPSVRGDFRTYFIKLMPQGDTIIEFELRNASGTVVTKSITISREPLPYRVTKPILTANLGGLDQVNINSNYIVVELEAEGADQVLFGRKEAEKLDVPGIDTFRYEVTDLRSGKNTVKFTVVRGSQKVNGSFIVYYTDTPVIGAQYKRVMSTGMKVFGGDIQLQFPRGTLLMRNNSDKAVSQIISSERSILFGIADPVDGRLDKYKYPTNEDRQPGNPNPSIQTKALQLQEETGRFRPASPLYWIDAGTIKDQAYGQSNEDYLEKALTGGGRLPYDADDFMSRNDPDLVVPTQRGELTLKYDPNIARDAWKYVTVMRFEKFPDYRGIPGSRWRNLGGVVNPKDNTITVPFDKFGYYRVMYMSKSFDDVTNHPWARDDLDILYTRDIMRKKGEYSFIPNDPISRGEFVTMLVKIFELPVNADGPGTFQDVYRFDPFSDGLYEYQYIETAARAGIVRGTTGGMFMPGSSITRQDAAVMIARIAELKLSTDLDKSLASLQKTFTDGNRIDIYARAAVEAVEKAGFIEGKENVLRQGEKKATVRFDPLETFTRAEAAAVAVRVMKSQKKIPK